MATTKKAANKSADATATGEAGVVAAASVQEAERTFGREPAADFAVRERNAGQLPEAAFGKDPTPDQSVKTDKEGKAAESDAGYETVTVRAADPRRVGVFEINPAHEGGEVFVAGEEPQAVARTPEVSRAIAEGRLVEVK